MESSRKKKAALKPAGEATSTDELDYWEHLELGLQQNVLEEFYFDLVVSYQLSHTSHSKPFIYIGAILWPEHHSILSSKRKTLKKAGTARHVHTNLLGNIIACGFLK